MRLTSRGGVCDVVSDRSVPFWAIRPSSFVSGLNRPMVLLLAFLVNGSWGGVLDLFGWFSWGSCVGVPVLGASVVLFPFCGC